MAQGLFGSQVSGPGRTIAGSADNFLKNWYIKGNNLNSLMYADDPFLNRLKRKPATQTVGGDEIVVPVRVGRSPSQSKSFSHAQELAKERTGTRRKWLLKVDDEYGVARVDDKAILASKNDRGAFVRLLKDECDSAIEGVHQRRCTALFAEKVGLAAKVQSHSATNKTITLQHPTQATAFDIGDDIEVRVPSGAMRDGPFHVTKVDRSGGVITVDKPTNLVAGIANNDEIYRVGDYEIASGSGRTGNTRATGMTSLAQWLPFAAPTGMLNNVDRSIDPVRLGGHREAVTTNLRTYTGTGQVLMRAVRKLCAKINQLTGKNPTIAVMSPLIENVFAIEQENQIRFDKADGKGASMMISAGIGGLSIKTAKGEIDLLTSSFCPVNTIYVLNESDLALYYLAEDGGDFVFFKKNPDGSMFKVSHDAAGIECRIESFGNLAMQAPGLHGRINLTGTLPIF